MAFYGVFFKIVFLFCFVAVLLLVCEVCCGDSVCCLCMLHASNSKYIDLCRGGGLMFIAVVVVSVLLVLILMLLFVCRNVGFSFNLFFFVGWLAFWVFFCLLFLGGGGAFFFSFFFSLLLFRIVSFFVFLIFVVFIVYCFVSDRFVHNLVKLHMGYVRTRLLLLLLLFLWLRRYRRAVVVDEAHRMRNKNSALLGCLQQVRPFVAFGFKILRTVSKYDMSLKRT